LRDWRSRQGNSRLLKEDTELLFEGYIRGTRFSLNFAPLLLAVTIQAAAIFVYQFLQDSSGQLPKSLKS
jgi:hypothetical protein